MIKMTSQLFSFIETLSEIIDQLLNFITQLSQFIDQLLNFITQLLQFITQLLIFIDIQPPKSKKGFIHKTVCESFYFIAEHVFLLIYSRGEMSRIRDSSMRF